MRELFNKMRRGGLLCWLAFLSVSGLVLYALFRPVPPEMIFEQSDKVGHVLAFIALALTGRLALQIRPLFLWGLMFILAFVLEWLQGELRPLRLFSHKDVYANMLGVLLAMLVFGDFANDKRD